jgi:molybdopterin converting factor small subunit
MDVKSMVTIELFGTQRAVAGIDSIRMPIGEGAVAKDVFRFIKANFPELDMEEEKMQLAVNHQAVSPERVLKANDIVWLIPHIGGG